MPSYNTEKYIKDSVISVLNQTYRNWELIIVDDCSTDRTEEVISPFLSDERIRYIKNESNGGAAFSRNRALREAKGKWIAFLDSDDLWLPEKLEKQIRFMQKHNYKFSYTKYEKIDEESMPLCVFVSGPRKVLKKDIYRYCWMGCLTVMYDAEDVGLIQIKDIKKNNDYAMWLQLCKKANCYLLPENLAKYRIRKKSISHDKLWKKLKSHYDLFHFCDEKPAVVAFWYACRNLWYGILKKIRYEKKIRTDK